MPLAGKSGVATSATPPAPTCAMAARSVRASKRVFFCTAWLITVLDALPNSSV